MQEALDQLTAPGGPFAMEEVEVAGHRLRVYCKRPRSLRDLLRLCPSFGDRTALVQGDRRIDYAEIDLT